MKSLSQKVGFISNLIAFTLISILIRGYQFGSGNQVHYFNFAFYRFYPENFSNDYLFKVHSLPFTYFDDLIYGILTFFGENAFVFFLIYFFFLALFYLLIYLISLRLFNDKRVSAILLLFFIYPLPVGGSTINTLEKSLMPRFVTEVLLIFSLYLIIIKKSIWSSVCAGVGFLLHPITMIPYIPVLFLSKVFEKKYPWKIKNIIDFVKELWKPALAFIIVASPLLYRFLAEGSSQYVFIDPEWKQIIKSRLPYLFVQDWSPVNYLALLIIFAFFVFYRRIFRKSINNTVKAVIATSLVLFAIALFSALTYFRPGLQLQLARNLYLLVVFSIIYTAGSILAKLDKKKQLLAAVLILSASVVLCYPVRKNYGILWINPLSDYQKAAVWAKDNTVTKSVFLVPLDAFGFRFWSKRSVFLEHKEGGDGLYDRDFAIIWEEREDLIIENKDFDEAYMNKLRNEYGVDFIVTTKTLSEEVVYKNDKYNIYSISRKTKGVSP